jgi:arylsulfatase A-like enzyme
VSAAHKRTGRLLMLGMVCLVVGCRREPDGPPAPLFRLIDRLERQGTVGDVTREWRSWGTLAHDSRPVLSVSRATQGNAFCPPERVGIANCHVILPPAFRSAAHVLVESEVPAREAVEKRVFVTFGFLARRGTLVSGIRPSGGRARYRARVSVATPGLRQQVTLRPVADPAAIDAITEPLPIPAGAELRFAVGIEESAWGRAAPTEFTVAVLDRERELPVFRHVLDPKHDLRDRGWADQRVALDAFAGRRVRLRFTARPTGRYTRHAILPLWADPVVYAPSPLPPPPNVLLVSLDTLRARSVSAYGSPRKTTDAFDRLLAAPGALFEQAIAPFPNTFPSHMSLFTGLYARSHGVTSLVFHRLAPEWRTLAEVLQAARYATAAFTENGFLRAEAGFRRGFGRYVEEKSPVHSDQGEIASTFGQGLAWLREHRDVPFFLFLHTYQVHWPYLPPEDYRAYFVDGSRPPAGAAADLLAYEQEVRYTDDHLRDVLGELELLGLADRTLVVVTSDHGEEFGEHGQRFHNFQLYGEVLRVPLAMRLPGSIPAGLRVSAPVSLVDVMPTILDLLGLPVPPGLDGSSLVPLLRVPPAPFEGRAVFAEAWSALGRDVDLTAAQTATHKCIHRGFDGAYDCFDLVADPLEEQVIGALDAPIPVRALLDKFRTGQRRGPGPAPTPAPDAETEKKLRALGYTQ